MFKARYSLAHQEFSIPPIGVFFDPEVSDSKLFTNVFVNCVCETKQKSIDLNYNIFGHQFKCGLIGANNDTVWERYAIQLEHPYR